jgi:hypothetical protein
MPDDFRFDVLLSHSPRDKPVACDTAKRLKRDVVKETCRHKNLDMPVEADNL